MAINRELWIDALRRWQETAPEESLITAVRFNEWSNDGPVRMALYPGYLVGSLRTRGREVEVHFLRGPGGELIDVCSWCGPRAACRHSAGLAEWALKVQLAPKSLSNWPVIYT